MVSTSGAPRRVWPAEYQYPIEIATRSGLFGPWDEPDLGDDLPGVNPGEVDKWGMSNFQIFPNLEILIWETGWYLLYRYWPTSHNTHRFEGTLFFAPSATASDRAARECAVVMFKEFALQDAGTLEGTQQALESRALGTTSRSTTRRSWSATSTSRGRLGRVLPSATSEVDRCRAAAPGRVRGPRAVRRDVVPRDRVRAVRAAHGQHHGRDAGVLRRRLPADPEALAYCDKFPLDDLPDDARHLLQLVYSIVIVAMCVEIWHQPKVIDGADAQLDRVGEPLP